MSEAETAKANGQTEGTKENAMSKPLAEQLGSYTWEREDDTERCTGDWLAARLVAIGARRDLDLAKEEVYGTPVGGRITTGVSAYVRIA